MSLPLSPLTGVIFRYSFKKKKENLLCKTKSSRRRSERLTATNVSHQTNFGNYHTLSASRVHTHARLAVGPHEIIKEDDDSWSLNLKVVPYFISLRRAETSSRAEKGGRLNTQVWVLTQTANLENFTIVCVCVHFSFECAL